MSKSEKALIYKDINEIITSKRVIIPMTIVPIIMVVIIPLVILISANYIGKDLSIFTKMAPLIKKLPSEYAAYNPSQLLIKIIMNLIFPSYFLIIPIMCSGVIGASSFVGEKEHKTMESLLYTPISMERLLRAKILGVFVPSYIITLISFIIFGILFNIGGFIYFSKLIFPDAKWLIIILWISPAINLLSLIFTVLVSAKSETFQEAQQVSGLLVIPIILVLVGQMTGVFLISKSVMIIGGGVILILDYILIKRISSRFIPERLI
ncbi:ABC transporter permease subunit [Clostridium tyrobutyricum]|jgi:ABC-type multidrug transport system permease subunit|uniref:ABC transporter permease subunit n=1 Tax=Clostridium tyrobutyricum TaxID=1519 RepID=UPI001C387EA4|nr:ABC transporter permease subunit [Clostridium tyrobutyricum]MBV4420431.1 ABC transporter permease subunit [Clostridium tyrobutyricum]MBV4428670.1 ABC transporter permease subunit [Clostridium tyrobutyricum]MBV4443811.1 ABC transporter permease subunit [Clostridium tyrobutyricum]MBV4447596.1 ABC transporter permease subunit [Clostridium tyrobutyricum]MBV4450898.1 ABC transporter permease subunit [Clostridium tyrobutyricum]